MHTQRVKRVQILLLKNLNLLRKSSGATVTCSNALCLGVFVYNRHALALKQAIPEMG